MSQLQYCEDGIPILAQHMQFFFEYEEPQLHSEGQSQEMLDNSDHTSLAGTGRWLPTLFVPSFISLFIYFLIFYSLRCCYSTNIQVKVVETTKEIEHIIFFLFKRFYLFLERGKGRGERGRNISVRETYLLVASHTHP